MAIRKVKSFLIKNVTDLPEEYDVASVNPESFFFVKEENRDFVAIISEYDAESDGESISIIINISSRNKMGYKEYLKIAKEKGIPYRILKCKGSDILSSIYATGQGEGGEGQKNEFDSEIIDEVVDLISDAIQNNVSDVHIEVRRDFSKVRFRKDGSLTTRLQITYSKGEKYAIVLYQALSTESGVVFNPTVPQDAMVDHVFNGIRARLRIATAPASPAGFDMVVRILKFGEKSAYTLLAELGYTEAQADTIYRFSSDPVGATIIAGTTGSGKSTTLKNVITKKIMDHKARLKVITVEDPPEYEIPHATQIPVIRDDAGSAQKGFSNAIRTAMRSDPDVLMVGEIRDDQSAALLVSATQSGHQVLTTVHAPSVVGIFKRLESLGIGTDTLSSSDFVSGLIYQKLLPKVCPHCSIPYKAHGGKLNTPVTESSILIDFKYCTVENIREANTQHPNIRTVRALQDMGVIDDEQVVRVLKEYSKKTHLFQESGFTDRVSRVMGGNVSMVRYTGDGCRKCAFNGVIGRLVVAEILVPNTSILMAVKTGDDLAVREAWLASNHGETIIQSASRKIMEGIVDPIVVEAEIGPLDEF
jgi:type II secretory ATPase GspE/PulE/Tfp pilus assembly ATPase PilB-like protein